MSVNIKKVALFLASILLLMGIIFYLNPSVLAQTISGADPTLIFFAFVFSNLALFFRIVKWKVLLKGVSIAEAAPVQIFGIAASNLTPGKVGEPVKSLALKMLKGIPVSTSLSTIIWERIMDIVIMMAFGAAGLYLIAASQYFYLVLTAILLFLFLISFLIVVLRVESIGRRAFGLLHNLPVLKNVSEDFLKNFYSNSGISRAGFLSCLTFTFFAWLFDGICFYLVLLSITNYQFDPAIPIIITCLLSLSILVGMLSSLPGGAGGTEWVMVILLSSINISTAVAGSVVLIGRFLTFGYSIILGYFAFLYLGRKIDVRSITKL